MQNKYKYIVVEGNIGAGKTTLAKKIAELYNARIVLENALENPYLPLFYEHMGKYSTQLEFSLLLERYLQLREILFSTDLFLPSLVADYGYFKSLVYAKCTLSDTDYHIFRKMYDVLFSDFPQSDLVIFLMPTLKALQENIFKRHREFELSISLDYLEKIQKGYNQFIKQNQNLKFLLVEVNNIGFLYNNKELNDFFELIVNQTFENHITKLSV